jgi:hypothetical protein
MDNGAKSSLRAKNNPYSFSGKEVSIARSPLKYSWGNAVGIIFIIKILVKKHLHETISIEVLKSRLKLI